MATAKTNFRPIAIDIVRPALVEAKLMTAKRARDEVYVATLAEELCGIERQLVALEETLHLGADEVLEPLSQRLPRPAPEGGWNAEWIRMKSVELDLRLRRLGQSSGSLLSE
jgi:hypothetical protein